MLLYNWSKIWKETEGKPTEIVRIIEMLYRRSVPKNEFDPIYKYSLTNFNGISFLLNPKDLIESQHLYSQREIAVYIGLAGKRKLADYIAFNKIRLDYLHNPSNAENLKQNRLLRVSGDSISFKLEEAYLDKRRQKNGTIIQSK